MPIANVQDSIPGGISGYKIDLEYCVFLVSKGDGGV